MSTGLLNFKMVTKYYENGNLRLFLKKKSTMGGWSDLQKQQLFLRNLAVNILEALVFLENQKVNVKIYHIDYNYLTLFSL